jgi:cytochrome P450
MRLSLTARSFFRDPIEYLRRRPKARPTLRVHAGPQEFVVLRDPELIWHVLVTDGGSFRPGKWKRRARRFLGPTLNTLEGDEHRRRRLLLQPALDRRRIAGYGTAIASRADRMQRSWRDGSRIVLRDELNQLAVAIAGEVLLSTELESRAPWLARALVEVMSGVPRFTGPRRGTTQQRALATVDAEVCALVAERRSTGEEHDDLLGLLLRDGLPDEVVRGEITAFLLAAVDEPPSALAATWYLLGRCDRAERRFHAELDTLPDGRLPGLLDEAVLPYLNAVLREVLRIYPPARHIDRCPVHGTVLDGRVASPRANILASPLVIHRDERLYDRPSEFVPERWLDGAVERRLPRGAYLPFGAGAHTCIGEPLARAIMTLTLATVGRHWRLRIDEDAAPPVPQAPPLLVTLERR